MKTLRQSIFLPVFALIAFLGFGAGTVLADSSNEGVGGWSTEAVGSGQVSIGATSSLSGIDGSDDARFTSNVTSSEPKRRAFVGTLAPTRATREVSGTLVKIETEISSISVTLQTSGGGEQVIGLADPVTVGVDGLVATAGVTGSTIFKFPGGPRAGTLTDGARVVVLAKQTEPDIWEAIFILVKPDAPPYTLHGVAVEVDGDQVTIETSNGEKKTVTLPEHARGVGPGEVITVFQDNSGKAKGLVRAKDVKIRLEKFLDDAETDAGESEEDEDGKGNKHDKVAAHAERIASFLARFSERQTRLIDRVIGRGASDNVQEKLAGVRARIQEQRAEHQQAIDRIRAKLDRQHPAHSHRGGADPTDRPDNSDRGRSEDADRPRPEKADLDQDGDPSTTNDGRRGRGRGRSQGDSS